MRFQGKVCLGLAFTLSLSVFATTSSTVGQSLSGINVKDDDTKSHTGRTSSQDTSSPATQSPASQSPAPQSEARQTLKPEFEKRKAKSDAEQNMTRMVEDLALSREKEIQRAMDLIEGVLTNTHRITPVGYKILTEVESATLVWHFDNDRAFSILKNAVGAIRRLLEEKNETTLREYPPKSKERELWILSLRKIAALKPELVQELLKGRNSSDKTEQTIYGKWTDEAHVLLTVAEDRMGRDTRAAGRIAEQSLTLGLADWASFLGRLSKRDPAEAQRLARVYIAQLRDSSITPMELRSFARFVLGTENPPELRDYYFQSIATKLRRTLHPGASERDLEEGLRISSDLSRFASRYSPQWQPEFDNLTSGFEIAFRERSLPLPGSVVKRVLDTSLVSAAKPADTQEVSDSVANVTSIRDLKARDKEYQKLAVKAAVSADTKLAEEIMSKISDAALRRDTTLLIYSPLVKKAIAESDWYLSQKLASLIQEPLGRTLAFSNVAEAVSKTNQARQDKSAVIDLYCAAMKQLDQEFATERVAKAYLVLAKPLHKLDEDKGVEALKSFAYTVNKLSIKDESIEEAAIESSLSIWIPYTNPALSADQLMNLPEMVTSAFEDLARRNVDAALSVSISLRDQGMYSFAQLAIAKALLEESKRAQPPSMVKRAAKE